MGLINLVSTTKARLYTFLGGKTAKSAEVNGELNQLVIAHNSLLADLAAVNTAIDTITGAGWAGDTIVSLKAGDISKDTAQTAALNTHKTSSDHDGRYFTEAEVTALVNAVTAALTTHKASSDHDGRYFTETEVTAIQSLLQSNINSNSAALTAHKTSSDHDGRYYTETEINALLAARDGNLNAHKTSSDHDGRYFTEAEVTALLNVIQGMVDTDILALSTHKTSADHDTRYNTKAEIIDLVSAKADWESVYTDAELSSTTADDTGAHLIGANVGGIVGDNVHAILLQLRDRINDAVAALIVDGSVTDIKLSDEPTAIKARVAEISTYLDVVDNALADLGDGQTAAEILVKLLTVDGSGSGLDADLLEGLSILDIGRMNSVINYGSTSDPNTPVAPFILTNHANGPTAGSTFFYIMTVGYNDMYVSPSNIMQIAIPYNSTNTMYYRYRAGAVWSAWLQLARTDSPAFSGNPTAPTPAITDNDTSIATTAYVRGQELKGQVTVTNTGWAASSIAGYVYKQAPIAGVVAADYPSGGFNGATLLIAKAAGIDYVECYAGGIVLAGTSVPSGSVTFDYVIRKA